MTPCCWVGPPETRVFTDEQLAQFAAHDTVRNIRTGEILRVEVVSTATQTWPEED